MKLLRIAIILMLILFGSNAAALELEYGRYNVNTYAHADCINTVCQIDFEKTYSTIPLAFFMSTVSFLDETDAPSSIRIIEVTKEHVKFKQKIAPAFNASPGYVAKPMTVIDYVVMEKGVHDFNGVKMIVGDISTQKFMYRKNVIASGNAYKNKAERINFNDYSAQGFSSFSDIPSVIHQVQTVNNGEDFWLTSTVTKLNSSFMNISLERGEIDAYQTVVNRRFPSKPETIGFIAALGTGKKNGLRFEAKNKMPTATTSGAGPVETGCGTYADFETRFDFSPIVIASKNTREGNNGGWLRRCQLENDRASFMIDEDLDYDDERVHSTERIGYFLFEVPMNRKSAMSACTDFTYDGTANNNATHTEMEAYDGEKKLTMGIMLAPIGNTTLGEVTMGNFFSIDAGSDGTSGQYVFSLLEYDGYNHHTKSLIKSLDVTSQVVTNHGFSLTATFDEELKSGKHYLLQVTASTGASIDLQAISHAFVAGGSRVPISISPELNLSGSIRGANPHTASLFSEFSNSTLIECDDCMPAVLNMSLSTLPGGSSCNQPTYQLDISPSSETKPVGESIPITFEIQDDKGGIVPSFSGNINVTPTGDSNTCWKVDDDVASACITDTSSLPISGGTATYYLHSNVVTEVTSVTAYVVGMGAITASSGPYQFNREYYTFDPSPLKIIAGKESDVVVSAMKSTSSGVKVMDDYDGTKTLILLTSYTLPNTGTLQTTLVNSDINFTDGVGTIKLKYNDAGEISVKARDATNDIEGRLVVQARPHILALCDPSVQNVVKVHNGTSSSGPGFARAGETFTVKIKPTIFDSSKSDPCERETTPNFYTDSGHTALANISFALETPSGGNTGTLTQENNAYSPATTYEFSSSSLAKDGITAEMNWNEVGSLKLTVSNPASPSYGLGGSGVIGSHDIVIGRFYPYQFELTNNYIQEGQSGDFTYMEQFFTSYFVVDSQSVDKDNVTSTTTNYERFDSSLLMHLNLVAVDDDKPPTSQENDLSSRLDLSEIANANWYKEWTDGVASIPSTELTFNRVQSQASPRVTEPDGSYQVRLGLEVDNNSVNCSVQGCTDFKNAAPLRNDGTQTYNGRKFTAALDMRYGRLKLDDVGGNSGESVTVPLRAEYWNGTKFVTNTDDEVTDFIGKNFCQEIIWSDLSNSSAVLSGADTLSRGKSAQLTASQNASVKGTREQVSFKLRIGDPSAGEASSLDCEGDKLGGMEYLQYNWFGEGDDNPSFMVTFGVYRGNDRVIFRGEPRSY